MYRTFFVTRVPAYLLTPFAGANSPRLAGPVDELGPADPIFAHLWEAGDMTGPLTCSGKKTSRYKGSWRRFLEVFWLFSQLVLDTS